MREMKYSSSSWFGSIPSNWDVGRIDSFYFLRNTKVSDTYYPPLSVTKEGVLPQLETAAKTNAHDDRKLVRKGDFAINSRSDRRGSCGISPYDGSVSLINTILAPKGEMDPEYYDWLFHTTQFADEFYKWGHGIVDDLWTTNYQDMKKINIPVPSLDEQHVIAACLNNQCSEIDALSADIQSEIDTLEAYKRSVITEAVTKGLDKNAEMKNSGIDWVSKVPAHWETIPFRYVLNERTDKNNPPRTDERLSLSIGLGVTRYEDKTTNLDRFKEDVSQYKLAHVGDLVMNSMNMIVGATGVSNYFGCVSPAYYTFFDLEEDHVIAKFCEYMFLTPLLLGELHKLGKGIMFIERGEGKVNTCRLKVSRYDLGKIVLPIPPILEMRKIVEYLNGFVEDVDTMIKQKKEQLEILADYKKSVIYEYVTGKKEVPAS